MEVLAPGQTSPGLSLRRPPEHDLDGATEPYNGARKARIDRGRISRHARLMQRRTDDGLFDYAIVRDKWRSKAATANGKQRQITANLLLPFAAFERSRGCGPNVARQGQGDGVIGNLPTSTPV